MNKLACKCTVELVWVPGHSVGDRNENASQLTRTGSESVFVEPESFVGF